MEENEHADRSPERFCFTDCTNELGEFMCNLKVHFLLIFMKLDEKLKEKY